jgi:hypothetical protein
MAKTKSATPAPQAEMVEQLLTLSFRSQLVVSQPLGIVSTSTG